MATPTITMATLPHPQSNGNKMNSAAVGSVIGGGGTGPDPSLITHRLHSTRRSSSKTGSVRHIIKNLANLSTGTFVSDSNAPSSLSSLSSSSTASTPASSLSPSATSASSTSPPFSATTQSTPSITPSSMTSPVNSDNLKNPEDVSPVRKHIIEEVNDDSVYSIQLKKITYSCTATVNNSRQTANSNLVTKCDQVDHRSSTLSRTGGAQRNGANAAVDAQQQSVEDNQQSLQWETRQLRTIKGATLEHLVKYVLFLTPAQKRLRIGRTRNSHSMNDQRKSVVDEHHHRQNSHHSHTPSSHHSHHSSHHHHLHNYHAGDKLDNNDDRDVNSEHRHRRNGVENDVDDDDNDDEDDDDDPRYVEERNNVAHAMHVLFATYRQFAYPGTLFEHIIRQRPFASVKQFNFILYYWLNNYPEDFWTSQEQQHQQQNHLKASSTSLLDQRSSSRNSTPTKISSGSIATIHSNGSSSSSVGHHGDSLETSEDGSSIYSEYTLSSNSSGNSFFHDSNGVSPLTLADQLIAMRQIDEDVKKHCLHLLDMKKDVQHGHHNSQQQHHHHHRSLSQLYSSTSTSGSGSSSVSSVGSSSQKSIQKTSSILDLDAKFIAQQLTAIDLENFLTLKPYTLLSNVRSKTKIETMIRNFNLLSRHVIVTILQSPTPHLVTQHWIEVAQQLRKMRNFNSLKATISGLTNESIHRLKSTIWNKLSRASVSTFQCLSSIVDDVNNQTLLRHTQLFIEGTSKVALDESFGTIPYLGTFLTDITMINTRYSNYIKTDSAPNSNTGASGNNNHSHGGGNSTAAGQPDNKRLINFEKCAKQYEILMQMQLLQKNAIAALQQQQQQNYHLGPIYSLNHYLSLRSQTVPSIPRVARIFRNWFQLSETDMLNDKECYQISLNIEPNVNKTKTTK